MYCPKCGQEVGDYTRICPGCGELLEGSTAGNVNPRPDMSAQPGISQNQQPQPGNYPYSQPQGYTGSMQPPQPGFNNYQQTPPNYAYNQQRPAIPDYKVQSILLIVFSSVLCCFGCISILALPFAIVALVNSNRVNQYINTGNFDLAAETSKKTKMWCWISFGILIACVILVIIYYIYLFSSGMYYEILDQIMEMQYELNY